MKGYTSRSGQWTLDPGWPGAKPLTVPCGGCIGCGIDHQNEWIVRMLHELQLHEEACYVTLTYNNENLPTVSLPNKGELELWATLHPRDLTLFWKRLRKHLGIKIRYFAIGEYGDVYQRPHYHFILYGYSFPDQVLAPPSIQKDSLDPLYVSQELSSIWPFGYHSIGSVTEKSIAYVARYTVNKRSKRERRSDKDPRKPIFSTQSRNPGIGGDWFKRWRTDVYPSDTVVIDGQERRPPRYYDRLLERDHPGLMAELKVARAERTEERKRQGFYEYQMLQCKKAIYEGQERFKKRNRCG